MKRYLPLVMCLLFGAITASAQFEYGAYAGLNASRLSGDSPDKFIYLDKVGPTFGAILNYRIKPDVRLSFQPGYSLNRPTLAFIDDKGDEPVQRDSVYLTLDFIKLPFFFDVLSDNRKWHFMGGVDLQLSLSQKAEDAVTGADVPIDGQLIDLNPVIYLGFGRRIPIGKPILTVDLRFGQGILNLGDNQSNDESLVPRIKTSSLELLVTCEFGSVD